MMAKKDITGASLAPIYNRLNAAPRYHPMEAETFADWSIEAGDIITVSRDGKDFQSPVNSATMTWKGAPKVTIGAGGNEKREPVAKVGRRKYNSGSGGLRNSQELYHFYVGVEGLFHEVYDTDGRFSVLSNTVEGLRHEVYDTDGRFSVLRNTVNGLYHEVYDSTGRFSRLQNTVDGLFHEVYDSTGRFSRLQNTVNGLYHEVYDTNGRYSLLKNTVDGLYHEVYDTNGRYSRLQNTVNGLYHEVYDTNGRFSTLRNTVDGLYHEVYDTNGRYSRLQNTVNGLYHEVYDTNGRYSKLQNTVNGLYHEVYDTNGSFSSLRNTVGGLYSEVYQAGTGLTSRIESLGDRISLVVTDDDNPAIKPASIVTAINNSQSTVIISANKINLDGYVTATSLDSNISNLAVVHVKSIQAASGTTNSTLALHTISALTKLYIGDGQDQLSITRDVLAGMVKTFSVSGNTLTLTPFDGDPVTFSRATTLTKGWSGGTFTVTASPQGNQATTTLNGIDVTGDTTRSGTQNLRVPLKVTYNNGQPTDSKSDTGYTETITVSAAPVYTYAHTQGRTNGWEAAYNELAWPAENTQTASMKISHPASSVGTSTSHTYTVSVDNDYAYIKNGVGTTVARVANSASHSIGITVDSGSAIAGTQEGAQFISGCTQIYSNVTVRGHASGRYYKFKVTCGGATKWYYFTVTT